MILILNVYYYNWIHLCQFQLFEQRIISNTGIIVYSYASVLFIWIIVLLTTNKQNSIKWHFNIKKKTNAAKNDYVTTKK